MNTLCTLRDISRLIREFEDRFQQKYDLGLNEAMLLCSLKKGSLSSTELAEVLGLSTSNTSKVIKSVESKEFVKRSLGETDKRQMYFELTALAKTKLAIMKQAEPDIGALLDQIKGQADKVL